MCPFCARSQLNDLRGSCLGRQPGRCEFGEPLGLIDETVAKVCDGARDFRNLIHPSRERAEALCDLGSALAAVAAVENLVALFSGSR